MSGVYKLYAVFALYLVDVFGFMVLIFTLEPSMAVVLEYYWVPQLGFPLLWLWALKRATASDAAPRSMLYTHATKYFLVLLLVVVLVLFLDEPTEIDENIRTSTMMLILSLSAALAASLVVGSQTRGRKTRAPQKGFGKKKN